MTDQTASGLSAEQINKWRVFWAEKYGKDSLQEMQTCWAELQALCSMAEAQRSGVGIQNWSNEGVLESIVINKQKTRATPSPSPTGAVRRVPVELLREMAANVDLRDNGEAVAALMLRVHAMRNFLAASPAVEQGEPAAWIWNYADGRKSLRWNKEQRDLNNSDVPASSIPLHATPQPQQDQEEKP